MLSGLDGIGVTQRRENGLWRGSGGDGSRESLFRRQWHTAHAVYGKAEFACRFAVRARSKVVFQPVNEPRRLYRKEQDRQELCDGTAVLEHDAKATAMTGARHYRRGGEGTAGVLCVAEGGKINFCRIHSSKIRKCHDLA